MKRVVEGVSVLRLRMGTQVEVGLPSFSRGFED